MAVFRDILSLFVANACAGCGESLAAQEREICVRCIANLHLTEHWKSPKDNLLYHRFGGKFPLAGACGLCYFEQEGVIQSVLHRLKYKASPALGFRMGEVFGEILQDTAWARQLDAIIPVPLFKTKERERGYNQSAKIAAGMSKQLGVPVAEDVVIRARATETQAQKNGTERWNNVSGAFRLVQEPPQNILLLDDVITTGSTIESCAHALHAAENPPKNLYISSVAVVR